MRFKEFFAMVPKDRWVFVSNDPTDPSLGESTSIRRMHLGMPCQCPISSVEGLLTEEWEDVADRIGLSLLQASMIVDAADMKTLDWQYMAHPFGLVGPTGDPESAMLMHPWRHRIVRKALLNAVGLKEVSHAE